MSLTRHRVFFTLPILALLLLPSTASANAGTPLMWASALHLIFGNAIIGVIEGLLFGWVFKCSKWKAMLILVVANYASAWVGKFFVADYLASLPDITIQTIQLWFWCFVLVAFVVTLLMEFPFFWFALRSQEHSLRRAFVATLVIHGVSYAVLFGWYGMASETSMVSKLKVVSVDEMVVPESYSLYFISREGDQILCMDLNDPGSVRQISEVAAHHKSDRLFFLPSDGPGFDLFVYYTKLKNPESESELPVVEDFSDQVPVDSGVSKHGYKIKGSWDNFGRVPAIGTESNWEFSTGFWASEGLSGKNEKTGERVHYSLELPFAAWHVRNATQVNGDYVVAQLGDDQICIIHLKFSKIALISRGKGPIVAKTKLSNR